MKTEAIAGTPVDTSKYWKKPVIPFTTIVYIFLCPFAWRLYDACRWRALDRHREKCRECWRKEVDTK